MRCGMEYTVCNHCYRLHSIQKTCSSIFWLHSFMYSLHSILSERTSQQSVQCLITPWRVILRLLLNIELDVGSIERSADARDEMACTSNQNMSECAPWKPKSSSLHELPLSEDLGNVYLKEVRSFGVFLWSNGVFLVSIRKWECPLYIGRKCGSSAVTMCDGCRGYGKLCSSCSLVNGLPHWVSKSISASPEIWQRGLTFTSTLSKMVLDIKWWPMVEGDPKPFGQWRHQVCHLTHTSPPCSSPCVTTVCGILPQICSTTPTAHFLYLTSCFVCCPFWFFTSLYVDLMSSKVGKGSSYCLITETQKLLFVWLV